MYFKPKIFLSSVMKNKLELRKEIKSYFEKAGAEIVLYEKDLTPSIDKNAYRQDILKTDFVIFIIDENYGNKTEKGLSGTEEEFRIISDSKKLCHVYLSKSAKLDDAKKFENLINEYSISYYYYENEEELKTRIFSTIFTIAKDITYNNMSIENVDFKAIKSLAMSMDYQNAIKYKKIVDRMFEIDKDYQYDIINSNLTVCFSDAEYYFEFIDKKLEEKYLSLKESIDNIAEKISNESLPRNRPSIEIDDMHLNFNEWNIGVDIDEFKEMYKKIKSNYLNYIEYIKNLKIQLDSIN